METHDSTDTTKTPQQWVIQVCAMPGCCVDIRVKAGEQVEEPICKWHQAGTAYNSAQIKAQPDDSQPISLEEFGPDLFEAIRTQSALRQAERTAALYEAKGKMKSAREYQAHADALQKQLKTILDKNTIAPADLQRLLAIT